MSAEADAARRGDRLDLLQPEPEGAGAAVEPADELEHSFSACEALNAALPGGDAARAVDGGRHVAVTGHPIFGKFRSQLSWVCCSQEDATRPSLESPQGFHLFRHMESNRWVLGLEYSQELSPEQLEACATLAEAEFMGTRTWRRAGQDVQITVTAYATGQEAMDCVAAKAGSIPTAEEVTAALERKHAGNPHHIQLGLDPGISLRGKLVAAVSRADIPANAASLASSSVEEQLAAAVFFRQILQQNTQLRLPCPICFGFPMTLKIAKRI